MTTSVCEGCGATVRRAGSGRPRKLCDRCAGGARYGGEHQRLRRETKEAAYGTPCARCGQPLVPGQEIHLDHDDADPTGRTYLGWSHARCNTAAGAAHSNRLRAAAYRAANGRAAAPAAPARAAGLAVTRSGPPYDPGPRRAGIEHHAGCRCELAAAELGAWPSRCW